MISTNCSIVKNYLFEKLRLNFKCVICSEKMDIVYRKLKAPHEHVIETREKFFSTIWRPSNSDLPSVNGWVIGL